MTIEVLLRERIADVPDFPKPGIVFKDITPILIDPEAFRGSVDAFASMYGNETIDAILGIESRGFLFGAALAYQIGAPFIPVRKPGKLPRDTVREDYALEYGTDALEMHKDAVGDGHSVLIIDDLLATGGTAAAARSLIEKSGAEVVGLGFVVELSFLNGIEKLSGSEVHSLIKY